MASNKRGPGKVGQRIRKDGKWYPPDSPESSVEVSQGLPDEVKATARKRVDEEAKRATRKVKDV